MFSHDSWLLLWVFGYLVSLPPLLFPAKFPADFFGLWQILGWWVSSRDPFTQSLFFMTSFQGDKPGHGLNHLKNVASFWVLRHFKGFKLMECWWKRILQRFRRFPRWFGPKKWEVDGSDDITFQVLRLLCLLLRSSKPHKGAPKPQQSWVKNGASTFLVAD